MKNKKIKFTKMHGIGNDFIILNSEELEEKNVELNEKLIQKMCDRNFGIGSDGIVLVKSGEKIKFKYVIYNPDGTEAEMCGNGIRCYMKYLFDKKLSSEKNIDVETGAGILKLDIDENSIITVDMGKPKLVHKDFPINKGKIISENREFEYFAASMGNPHCIIFLEENIWDFDLKKYGAPIEKNTDIFPNKVNVEFVKKISETELDFRVYERGTGETLACGTGACASVVAGISLGFLEKNKYIKINLQGGNLFIKWSGSEKDSVIMKGEAEIVFEGEYDIKI